MVTKFALALDALLTTKETKATLTGTSDEPAPCASGSMCQEAALGPCSRSHGQTLGRRLFMGPNPDRVPHPCFPLHYALLTVPKRLPTCVCVCVYTAPSDQLKLQVALFSPMEYLCPVGVDQNRALIGRWKLSNKYRKQQLSWKLPQHLQDTVGSDLTRVLTDGGKGGSKMGAVKDQRPQFRHQRGEKEWGRREEAQ